MNVSSMLSSDFLNGQELAQPQIVTVRGVEVKELGDEKDQKVVLSFYELPKSLPLNKTRLKAMVESFGPETTVWINQRVMVHGERLNSGKFAGQWTIILRQAPAMPVQSTTPALATETL